MYFRNSDDSEAKIIGQQRGCMHEPSCSIRTKQHILRIELYIQPTHKLKKKGKKRLQYVRTYVCIYIYNNPYKQLGSLTVAKNRYI